MSAERVYRLRGPRGVLAERLYRPGPGVAWALGLLARAALQPDEGLWLVPGGSIHTWGLRYAIDVLFLDHDLRVLRVSREVRPWRVALAPRGTAGVVELPAGAGRVEPGDPLSVEQAEIRR